MSAPAPSRDTLPAQRATQPTRPVPSAMTGSLGQPRDVGTAAVNDEEERQCNSA